VDSSASASGPYSVAVTMSDGNGGSVTQNFTWNVSNPGPIANDDAFTALEDDAASVVGNAITNNDSDPDGDALTAVVQTGVTGTSGGLFSIVEDGQVTFDPDGAFEDLGAGETRETSFTYTLADLQLAREAAQEFALEARQIEAQIEQRTLRAPFDGVVARVHRDPGAGVSTQDGPVISLVQLAQLDLVVHIDHRRLDGLAVGQELSVEALDRPVKATARIAFISPVVDASSGTARVRLELPNGDGAHRSGVKYRIDLADPVTQP
jgi:hypothetical protein